MAEMMVLITTLGRLHNQITLFGLPEEIRQRTFLVVQRHEFHEACRLHGTACRSVIGLPEHITNLGATRQFLLDTQRGRKMCLMDDDLTLYVRPSRLDWRLRTPTESQIVEMFDEIEWKLDDYAHVGVSGREGNNREREYGVESTRYMRILAWNTAKFPLQVRADRVDGMSDFDVNLQLLRHGLPSYVFYRYANGQSQTQAEGGCALNRTHETHAAEVELMCRLHPGLVKRRLKVNKSGGDFGTRDELTIYWKTALDHNERMRAHVG